MDNDRNDNDYCYIEWTWTVGGGGRYNLPQDFNVGNWNDYLAPNPQNGSTEVTWRVCKERQNAPDICSAWIVEPK